MDTLTDFGPINPKTCKLSVPRKVRDYIAELPNFQKADTVRENDYRASRLLAGSLFRAQIVSTSVKRYDPPSRSLTDPEEFLVASFSMITQLRGKQDLDERIELRCHLFISPHCRSGLKLLPYAAYSVETDDRLTKAPFNQPLVFA